MKIIQRLFLVGLAALIGGDMLWQPSEAYAEASRRLTPAQRRELLKRRRALQKRKQQQRTPSLAAPSVDVAQVVGTAYENRIKTLLERYIPLKEFNVTVKVTPTDKPLPITPYDPTGAVIANSSPQELAEYVQRVDIELLLTSRVKPSQNRIENLVRKELGLRKSDRVRMGNLGIEIESEAWTQEKNDLKSEMSRLKSENDRISRELSRSQAQEGFLGKYTKWAVLGALVGVFGILLGALMIVGRSVFTLGKSVGTAVTAVAGAMESVGSSIQAAAGISPDSGPQTLEAKMISDGSGKKKGGGGPGMANLPMDSIHAHFAKLRGEILENMNDGTESVILRQLTQLLANPATVGRAVVTMELLGRDMAMELFKRLGLQSQEAILRFMREGGYDEHSKVEMMLEAGEELKTKILVDSLDMARGRPSEKVAEKILQLSTDDLSWVIQELSPDLYPRLFLYLDAPKIAAILSQIKSDNPKQYDKTLSLLSKMPDAETTNHQDQDILGALDKIINQTKSDAQRPFLKVYQEIIEAAEDDLGEDIVRTLSADPRIDSFLKENVITVATFFRLTDDARNEMIESLSNKDVAALASGVKDEERKLIMQALPNRRKGLIAEEFESLTSRGGRQAQYAFRRVRDIIVKKLRDMKTEGSLGTSIKAQEKGAGNAPRALGAGGRGGKGGKPGAPAAPGRPQGGKPGAPTAPGRPMGGAKPGGPAPGARPMGQKTVGTSPGMQPVGNAPGNKKTG